MSDVANRPDPSALPDRERARKRLQDRRDFSSHAVAYIVLNTLLIGVWAFTGAGDEQREAWNGVSGAEWT